MEILFEVEASRSSTSGSMTILRLSAGWLMGEGVEESEIRIGVLGVFGGVDSYGEGISRIS